MSHPSNGLTYAEAGVDIDAGVATLFGDPKLPSADNLAVGAVGEVYVTGFDQPTVTVLGPDGQVSRTVNIGGS